MVAGAQKVHGRNRWMASNMPCGVNFSVSYAPMQAPQIH